jgi:hypothetical protein
VPGTTVWPGPVAGTGQLLAGNSGCAQRAGQSGGGASRSGGVARSGRTARSGGVARSGRPGRGWESRAGQLCGGPPLAGLKNSCTRGQPADLSRVRFGHAPVNGHSCAPAACRVASRPPRPVRLRLLCLMGRPSCRAVHRLRRIAPRWAVGQRPSLLRDVTCTYSQQPHGIRLQTPAGQRDICGKPYMSALRISSRPESRCRSLDRPATLPGYLLSDLAHERADRYFNPAKSLVTAITLERPGIRTGYSARKFVHLLGAFARPHARADSRAPAHDCKKTPVMYQPETSVRNARPLPVRGTLSARDGPKLAEWADSPGVEQARIRGPYVATGFEQFHVHDPHGSVFAQVCAVIDEYGDGPCCDQEPSPTCTAVPSDKEHSREHGSRKNSGREEPGWPYFGALAPVRARSASLNDRHGPANQPPCDARHCPQAPAATSTQARTLPRRKPT